MSLDLSPGIYHGALVEVLEAEGTGLFGAHSAGATTLTVAAGGFRNAGQCLVDGNTYAYTRSDVGDTLTITPGLLAAAEDGTPVLSLTPSGAVESQTKAIVDLDMTGEVDGEDLPRAWVPGELAGFYPLGTAAAGSIVGVADTTYGYRLVGRPTDAPLLDGTAIDPATLPTGQQFSDVAPTDADAPNYPEGFGWWQVDADNNVLGFWRLTGGAWTPATVVTMEALQANNILTKALDGETITGATVQTRSTPERGIKLIAAVDEVGAPLDAFYVYDEAGVPFITAIPKSGMAIIAGELKAASLTVSPLQADDKVSLAGLTEIVRNPDGTAGVLRLTAYTTKPASAPTVTTSYDTVQFTADGLWGNRRGWSTDGTYWYTGRQSGAALVIEKWNAAGALVSASTPANGYTAWGCAVNVSGGYLYALARASFGGVWVHRYNLGTLALVDSITTGIASSPTATIGYDPAAGHIILAQSVLPDNKVRIARYNPVFTGGSLPNASYFDTAFGYANDLAGVYYGSADLGANRYIFTTTGGGQFRVVDTTGAAVSAEDWQAGTGPKVGFTYTGGAFVSMDQDGIMRTYTGQDKATAIGSTDLIKYVSNTLANATLETDQSPRAKITVDKRTKLNVTTSSINSGGTNAPDRVKVYVGKATGTGADPGRTGMWKQTLGTVPGQSNLFPDGSFEAAALGTAASWATVSGSTTPTVTNEQAWPGTSGPQSLKTQRGAGTAIQIASRTITSLLTAGAGSYSYNVRVFIPTGVATAGNTGIRIAGAGTTTQDKDTDLRNQWVTLSGTFVWDGVGAVILYSLDSAITAGITIYLDGIHIVSGTTPPTTYYAGDDPVGVTTFGYSSLATSGTNPVTPNQFIAAGGTVQRVELADGTVQVDGLGNGSAWTTYTPTWTAATTNPVIGNGSITGRYAKLGRNTIQGNLTLTIGSTTTIGSGNYTFTLPVAARNIDEPVPWANQSAPRHSYTGRLVTTTTFQLFLTATDSIASSTSAGLTSGSVLVVNFQYEAA